MFPKATTNQGEIERIKTEAKILSDIDHPNIVKFYEVKKRTTAFFQYNERRNTICIKLYRNINTFIFL